VDIEKKLKKNLRGREISAVPEEPEESSEIERISVLGIPLDLVPPERLEAISHRLLNDQKGHNIVLLSLWDLLKARRNDEYRAFLERATMVIPIAKSLVGGARFLLRKKPYRYMPFDFVINLLSILEKREFSLYLLGGKIRILKKAEKNLRQTFPSLRIVGRYVGSFKRHEEPTILEAVRKASPSLLLVGKGVRGGERWIVRHSGQLNNGFRLWCSDLFEIFAERRRRPGRAAFDHGLEWLGFCIHKPWRFLRVFLYMYYKILLGVYRIFGLD
jgi:N-acetylglucosaminyldiphosphoundecaprenol N-acetyl-beta-D-mannosaminyltransferase